MSFWDDVVNAVEAPFKAIGTLVSNVAQGGNVAQNLEQFIGKNVFVVDPVSNSVIQGDNAIGNTLRSSTASKVTLGLSSDVVAISNYNSAANVNQQTNVDPLSAAKAFGDAYLKVGAAAVGASEGVAASGGVDGVTSAAEVTGATYGAVGTEQQAAGVLNTPSVSGVSSSVTNVTNLTGVDPGNSDFISAVTDAGASAQQAVDAATAAQNAAAAASGAAGAAGQAATVASGAGITAGQAASGAQSLLNLVKSNTPAVVNGYTNTSPAATAPVTTTSMALPLIGLGLLLLMRRAK